MFLSYLSIFTNTIHLPFPSFLLSFLLSFLMSICCSSGPLSPLGSLKLHLVISTPSQILLLLPFVSSFSLKASSPEAPLCSRPCSGVSILSWMVREQYSLAEEDTLRRFLQRKALLSTFLSSPLNSFCLLGIAKDYILEASSDKQRR